MKQWRKLETVREISSDTVGDGYYIVTYTAGESENMREWTVYAMDTDTHTYLYGFCAVPDAADDMQSVYQDIFAGLYLSDGESVG